MKPFFPFQETTGGQHCEPQHMERNDSELHLPGFRFHPTEEELLDFYLRRVVRGEKLDFDFIGSLNIYHYDPWELPGVHTCEVLYVSFAR